MIKRNIFYESIIYIYNEHLNNRKSIPLLGAENMNQQTLRTSLGIGWVFFRDLVYFTAFAVFRYLMAGAGEIEGMHFVLFLMVGMIPWNFMNECISGGVYTIKINKTILSSIKFPVTILPTVEVIAIFIKRLFTLGILALLIVIFGDISKVTLWLFLYYFFSMFIIMCVWNLVFSAIFAISNDFEQLYIAFTSILFFTLPVMWSFDILKNYPWIIRLFKLNPLVYLIEGFRGACQTGVMPDFWYTIYFWGIVSIMFLVGAVLQFKLKNHYIDLI